MIFVKQNNTSGFSLLEVLIAASIMGGVMAIAVSVLLTSLDLKAQTASIDHLRTKNEITLFKIAEEFSSVSESSIVSPVRQNPPVGFSDQKYIRYRKIEGVDEDGVVTLSTKEYSVGFEYYNGETNNGKDDNRNGMVDEGALVFREYSSPSDTTGRAYRTVLYVAENYVPDGSSIAVGGFSVSLEPNDTAAPTKWLMRINLALEGINYSRSNAKQSIIQNYYKSSSVSLSN